MLTISLTKKVIFEKLVGRKFKPTICEVFVKYVKKYYINNEVKGILTISRGL